MGIQTTPNTYAFTVGQAARAQSTNLKHLSATSRAGVSISQSDAQPHIIREWLNRADGQRTEQDIIQFYSYLERAHHDLLAFAANANRPRILKDMLHHFMDH